MGNLVQMQILIPEAWGGALDLVFVTSFQLW